MGQHWQVRHDERAVSEEGKEDNPRVHTRFASNDMPSCGVAVWGVAVVGVVL